MNNILVLDTSTHICSASYYQNENLITSISLKQPNKHSEKAAEIIHQLLKISSISPKQLSHLAVAKGPGSYTGLRIGISIIKGLSYGLNIPVIAYSSLLAQAAIFFHHYENHSIISSIDAGRNEVYLEVYTNEGFLSNAYGAVLLPNSNIIQHLEENQVILVGNGSKKILDYHQFLNKNYKFFHTIDNPTLGLGSILMNKIHKNDFEDLSSFEPEYLKPVNITQSKK